jgi:hypothetical protein
MSLKMPGAEPALGFSVMVGDKDGWRRRTRQRSGDPSSNKPCAVAAAGRQCHLAGSRLSGRRSIFHSSAQTSGGARDGGHWEESGRGLAVMDETRRSDARRGVTLLRPPHVPCFGVQSTDNVWAV